MREDWSDVLVTRARWDSGREKPGRPAVPRWTRADLADDEVPRQGRRPARGTVDAVARLEPMRWRSKCFSDLLGPLKRLLASRVGRPWDDVWSEICGVIDRRGLLQQHVVTHLLQFVALEVQDGPEGWVDRRHHRPLRCGRWRQSYYVDPADGRLRRAPERRSPASPP